MPTVAASATIASSASSAVPDARADADTPDVNAPIAAPRWLTFDGPPFVTETPMHGGPAWTVSTPKLPARSRASGILVVPFSRDRGLSTVPNLAVRFLSANDARVTRTADLLRVDEFDRALATGDARRASFEALGALVRARVAAMNDELDARGADLVPLDACTVDPPNPFADWPPCGSAQALQCGGQTLRYLGGRQTLETSRGRRTFPTWRKPKVHSNDGFDVVVNECVAEAWIDVGTKLLVLHVANLCAVPGDWCSVESDWRFVRLDR